MVHRTPRRLNAAWPSSSWLTIKLHWTIALTKHTLTAPFSLIHVYMYTLLVS